MCLNSARRQRRLKRLTEQWGDLHAAAVTADAALALPAASPQLHSPTAEPELVRLCLGTLGAPLWPAGLFCWQLPRSCSAPLQSLSW